jgi:hypothetical protein
MIRVYVYLQLKNVDGYFELPFMEIIKVHVYSRRSNAGLSIQKDITNGLC